MNAANQTEKPMRRAPSSGIPPDTVLRAVPVPSQVTGTAVSRIAEPRVAFRMLNFSFPERASEKLEQILVELFVGAVRGLVANLTVEQWLTRR